MWTTIFIVHSRQTVLAARTLLENARVICKIKPVGETKNADDTSFYEILVPGAEVQKAHTLLIANGY